MKDKYQDTCPVCGDANLYWDRCPSGWTTCVNGHKWQTRVTRAKYQKITANERYGDDRICYELVGWEVVYQVGRNRWEVEVIEYLPEFGIN